MVVISKDSINPLGKEAV